MIWYKTKRELSLSLLAWSVKEPSKCCSWGDIVEGNKKNWCESLKKNEYKVEHLQKQKKHLLKVNKVYINENSKKKQSVCDENRE